MLWIFVASAAVTQNRHRIKRTIAVMPSIRIPGVAAVLPGDLDAAVRAGAWAVACSRTRVPLASVPVQRKICTDDVRTYTMAV
jgi:hypothetical protein